MEPTQIQLMLNFGLRIIEADSGEQIFTAILEGAMTFFRVQEAGIALLDGGGNLVFIFNSSGENRALTIPAGQGFAGWVIRHGRPILSNDPQSDARLFTDVGGNFEIKSLMCAPLMLDGKPAGVIEMLNTRKSGGFNNGDLELLVMFARMAASALTKHRKFQTMENARSAFWEADRRRNRMVGLQSRAMKEVMAMAQVAANSSATVLLMSESGTGKELTARSIHRWSPRAKGPFVAVNCVALTTDLLASELFGHEKGAFTGAVARKIGKFELADKGAIFLDEIGELSPDLQSRLLRVLQEREFQRVGGNESIRVDVRIIAATNRDLEREVALGRFREDLYYRLNVIKISLPPLRERKQDIRELVQFFIQRFCREMGRPIMALDPGAEQALEAYDWPGNVRQLQNTIERAVVLTRGSIITAGVLPAEIVPAPLIPGQKIDPERNRRSYDEGLPLRQAVEQFKATQICRALDAFDGNQAKAAKRLGLQASNLSRMIKAMGLKPDTEPWWKNGL